MIKWIAANAIDKAQIVSLEYALVRVFNTGDKPNSEPANNKPRFVTVAALASYHKNRKQREYKFVMKLSIFVVNMICMRCVI